MKPHEFLRPRLLGTRFEKCSLPLDLLKDLSALQELVIEVAKSEYLAENPSRKRSPKGFARDFALHLTELEAGSTIPVIVAMMPNSLFPEEESSYFEKAKMRVIEAVEDAATGKAPRLASKFLRFFEHLGRSLREGEAMEFTHTNGRSVALSPIVRKRLLQASQIQEWTEELSLKGRICEIDKANQSFEFELYDGTKLKAPLLELHEVTVLDAVGGYPSNAAANIKGIFRRSRSDRLKSIDQIEHVTLLDPLDIDLQLEEIAQLKDGWLDGEGTAYAPEALRELAKHFDRYFSPNLPLPRLYPMPEGGIQAEWTFGRWEVTLPIQIGSFEVEYQAMQMDTKECRDLDFSLSNAKGWQTLNEQLEAITGGQA